MKWACSLSAVWSSIATACVCFILTKDNHQLCWSCFEKHIRLEHVSRSDPTSSSKLQNNAPNKEGSTMHDGPDWIRLDNGSHVMHLQFWMYSFPLMNLNLSELLSKFPQLHTEQRYFFISWSVAIAVATRAQFKCCQPCIFTFYFACNVYQEVMSKLCRPQEDNNRNRK